MVAWGDWAVVDIAETAEELRRKAQACRRLADIAESVGDPERAATWLLRAKRWEEQLAAIRQSVKP
jgi:hypothetical protein